MKLWLISQTQNSGWDTFDSAVVVAESEEEAKKIHPRGTEWYSGDWCSSPDDVRVEYVGEAKAEAKSGTVICSSFNAG